MTKKKQSKRPAPNRTKVRLPEVPQDLMEALKKEASGKEPPVTLTALVEHLLRKGLKKS